MAAAERRYFAPAAWIRGTWAYDVVLQVGADGRWSGITPGPGTAARSDATVLPGPVLPGLVNGHSHAFQRAIAGLTERSGAGDDDFWRWRDRMYSAANRITPPQLEAIATYLYAELLQAGYTQVCEFHYLHGAGDDALESSMALVNAARATGIGLTLLPTLYMHAGFGGTALRDDQQRFASNPGSILRLVSEVGKLSLPRVNAGVAFHSVRAVGKAAMLETLSGTGDAMPIHIHIAEQRREVEDCLDVHGKWPVQWLLDNVPVDERWNLVHATHCTPEELEALRQRRAAIVICPSTEANLGDGVFDLPAWLGQSGNWSIGSDSHVTRSWQEELRLLEYSQRLHLRRRNVAASSALSESSAAALFEGALAGGSAAAGEPLGGIAPGQRADFSVLDLDSQALAGIPHDHLLDAAIFSAPHAALREVYVAGERVTATPADHRAAFTAAMRSLWP